jgi:hypothetical protein
MEVRLMGVNFFHVNKMVDMMKLIVTFHKFENAPSSHSEL